MLNALEASTIPKDIGHSKATISEEGFEPYDKIVQLKLPAEDGKLRETDCVPTQRTYLIIQSIPSQKLNHLSFGLPMGYDRVQEIENSSWRKSA